jgi:hypothetical protein
VTFKPGFRGSIYTLILLAKITPKNQWHTVWTHSSIANWVLKWFLCVGLIHLKATFCNCVIFQRPHPNKGINFHLNQHVEDTSGNPYPEFWGAICPLDALLAILGRETVVYKCVWDMQPQVALQRQGKWFYSRTSASEALQNMHSLRSILQLRAEVCHRKEWEKNIKITSLTLRTELEKLNWTRTRKWAKQYMDLRAMLLVFRLSLISRFYLSPFSILTSCPSDGAPDFAMGVACGGHFRLWKIGDEDGICS